MQVYAVLKPMEGRLKKAPRRVVAPKRKIDEMSNNSSAAIPILAATAVSPAAAEPNYDQNNFDQDIDLFKRGCANKARKFGPAWVKAMINAQRLEGHLPPED